MLELRKKIYFDVFDIFLVFTGVLIVILLWTNYIIYDDIINYIVKIENFIDKLHPTSVIYFILFILLFVNVFTYLRFKITIYINISNRFEFEDEIM
jgi:hypothetical protein